VSPDGPDFQELKNQASLRALLCHRVPRQVEPAGHEIAGIVTLRRYRYVNRAPGHEGFVLRGEPVVAREREFLNESVTGRSVWVPQTGTFTVPIMIFALVAFALIAASKAAASWRVAVACLLITLFLGLLALAGSRTGGAHAARIDSWFVDQNFTQPENDVRRHFMGSRRKFIDASTIFVIAYLLFYMYTIISFPVPERPFLPNVTVAPFAWVVTGATLFFQLYFVVRFANYVSLITSLKAVLDNAERPSSPESKLLLERLHDAAFRDDQIYEPAGNIFVTMGITATFLGLAGGLVSIDLRALAQGGNADSLSTFVAYMGLALGMSMLGVVTAMSAQWLRGQGPKESTESLLVRATQWLRGPQVEGEKQEANQRT
jgi:hypothetical protein